MKDATTVVKEELMRRTALQPDAKALSNQQHDKPAAGVQLLSPSMMESFKSNADAPYKGEFFGWSPSPTKAAAKGDNQSTHDNKSPAQKQSDQFDFDGFTIAAVQSRKAERDRAQKPQSKPSRPVNEQAKAGKRKSDDGTGKLATTVPLFDDEDPTLFAPATFDAQYQQLQLQERQKRGSAHSSSISSSTGSSGATPIESSFLANSAAFLATTLANLEPDRKAPAPPTKPRKRSAVLVSGWLEKRRGLVLKRWRPYYCVFKDDDSLYLYASEDTVNGRMEHRFTVLKVLLTDKNDSFHVIAVDAEGAARREEFRASVSIDWQSWFVVFRRFFDEDSLHEALLRKPELLLLTSPARPPAPFSVSDASPKSCGSFEETGKSSKHSDVAGGDQNDARECNRRRSNEANVNDRNVTARSSKPLTSRSSMAWARVEPLPNLDGMALEGRPNTRSMSSADGVGWQKSSRGSVDAPVDELRSTMSLYSTSSTVSVNHSGSANRIDPATARVSVGWTRDLDTDQISPNAQKPKSMESSVGWSRY